MNRNEERIKDEIAQSVLLLHQELDGRRDLVQRYRDLRQFFINQGFSTALPDAMIAEWEARVQHTQQYITHDVLEWFEGLREDCLRKGLPTADVDFAIAEWREQLRRTQRYH